MRRTGDNCTDSYSNERELIRQVVLCAYEYEKSYQVVQAGLAVLALQSPDFLCHPSHQLDLK